MMLGSMLAGTDEAPNNGLHVGMASYEAQIERGQTPKSAEGVVANIKRIGPLADLVQTIKMGLGSGCSYTGVENLALLSDRAEYVTITGAGQAESRPHAKER